MTTDAGIVAPIEGNQAAATGMTVGAAFWPHTGREVRLVSGTDDASIAQIGFSYCLFEIGQSLIDRPLTVGDLEAYLRKPRAAEQEFQEWQLQDRYLANANNLWEWLVPLAGSMFDSLIEETPTHNMAELHTQRKYVRTALEGFKKLNADEPSIIETLSCAIRILNLSIDRGYRPVVTLDEDDQSLEIEARLDPDRLLLLQAWASGSAEGIIFSDAKGFTTIEADTVSEMLGWLVDPKNEALPS